MNPWMRWLPRAGTLPFIALSGLLLGGLETLPVLGRILPLLQAYAAVITSFMAGTFWGLAAASPSRLRTRLLISSNVAALATWAALAWLPPREMLTATAAVLTLLLINDRAMRHALLLEGHYWRVRVQVTVIVVISLLAAALA